MNTFRSSEEIFHRGLCVILSHLAVGIIIAALYPVMSFAGAEMPASKDIQNNYQPADNSQWVKDLTRQYSPASWDLLMEYDHLPPEVESSRKGGWVVSMKKPIETFPPLAPNFSRTELIDKMALHLHVLTLTLQRLCAFRYTRENNILLDWERAEVFFYLSPARTFYVSFPMKSLYPAPELIPVIPESLRTSLFDAHIRNCKATQRFGIIGLLEEFQAHFVQARFYADMLPAYRTMEASEANGLLAWVRNSQSLIGAFYEFDFFILEYLLYMKQHYTSDYEALKSCRPFVEAYSTIRSSYEALVIQYLDLIQTEMQRLKASGKAQIGLDNGILWVRMAGSDKSRGTRILPERDKLLSAMSGDRYLTIQSGFPKAWN